MQKEIVPFTFAKNDAGICDLCGVRSMQTMKAVDMLPFGSVLPNREIIVAVPRNLFSDPLSFLIVQSLKPYRGDVNELHKEN